MNRRDLIKSTLLAAGAMKTGGALSEELSPQQLSEQMQDAHNWPEASRETSGERMPNVLWIIADQQRCDTLQGLNNSYIRTPNLRKLMGEGVTFTNAFVQTAICAPSRGSFLTGRYPHVTGLRSNGQRIRENERLVPRILADHDYACGLSGKLHLSPTHGGQTEDRIDDGYKIFWWSHDWSNSWPGKNMWRVWLQDNGIKFPSPPPNAYRLPWAVPIDPKYTQTAWCSDMAIQFMKDQRQFNPWLMSVNIFQPHHPFWPTVEYLAHYNPDQLPSPRYRNGELDNKPFFQKIDHEGASDGTGISFAKTNDEMHRKFTASYYAMIEQIDVEVGRMLQTLEDTGQSENTIVIYMSDHGEMLGDHGIYSKGPYFYDCLTRVPLIVRWPGKYKAGLQSDALVELIDIAPTLLEAAGIPIPSRMQGRSLTPLLTGRTTKHRKSVFTEYLDANHVFDPPPMATCVRTDRYKLAYYENLNTGELYDLQKDPGEVENLWTSSSYKGVRAEMTELLVARMIAATDPFPRRIGMW